MTIIPILRREMVAAARQGKLQQERRSVATMLFLMVGGSFWAWWYWSGGSLTSGTMARISDEALRWSLAIQCGIVGTIMVRGALSIAGERERRTLDSLMATRLSSGEIVLGKLAACMAATLAALAAGLPIMLLLHVLEGVAPGLIGLSYAAVVVANLFLSALAIWVSAEMPDRRTAGGFFLLGTMAWMIGPFLVTVFLPRWGIRLPDWLAAANWWLVTSSPVSIAFRIATGLRSWDQLLFEAGRMMALQAGAAVVFTVAAIVRLRPVHRELAGVDREAERRARRRLVWRFRPRPPVGDDPILWREIYTSRESGLLKGANLLIFGGLLAGLASATLYYARPAFVELWHHGYGSAATARSEPEMNILLRIFMPPAGAGEPADIARTEFNFFIRYATVAIIAIMSFIIGGIASEVLGVERLKDTWTSLLVTPLTSREVLRSVLLATAWRSRYAYGSILVLWVLGLAAGAVHPLGFLVSSLELVASVGLLAVYGILGSIQASKAEAAVGRGVALALILTGTGVLPMLFPAGFNPVLLGVGSSPLMTWTSLVSYREVATALATPFDPHFRWIGLPGGQMPMLVAGSWLVAIVGPAAGGLLAWRYAVLHFDRLVGRPWRAATAAEPAHSARLPVPSVPRPAASAG